MAAGTVINVMKVSNITSRQVSLVTGGRTISIPEMIRVEGGTFQMGSTRWINTQPIRQVTLSDFAIGKYPVTNGEYRGYLEVIGESIPELVSNMDLDRHPVVNISWNEAAKYCKFLMEITGRKFGLPTEAQWEFAARGTEGRIYPWGNESYEGRLNFHGRGTTPVDAYPQGQTPTGIFDMAGNVWEWTTDWHVNEYHADDLVNPKGPGQTPWNTCKVLRGFSYYDNIPRKLGAANRGSVEPEKQNENVGFRLAEDLG